MKKERNESSERMSGDCKIANMRTEIPSVFILKASSAISL